MAKTTKALKRSGSSVRRAASSDYQTAKRKAVGAARETGSRLRKTASQTKRVIKKAGKKTDEFIRRNPKKAVGIAAGIGAAAVLAAGLRRRSKKLKEP